MRFFANLKAGIEAAQAEGNRMAGAEAVKVYIPIVNPRPQAEVDQLLAGPGTIVRAIVVSASHQPLEPGERVHRMSVSVVVRARGPEGSVGDDVKLTAKLSSMTASLLDRGLDIPVERDPATGALTGVASDLLTQEQAARKSEADERNPAGDNEIADVVDSIKFAASGGLKSLFDEPEPPAPVGASVSDPRRQPIDRITWETWIAIRAQLEMRPAPNGADYEAQKFGVLPYTWLGVNNAWSGRVAADSELKALFDRDLAAAIAALGPLGS